MTSSEKADKRIHNRLPIAREGLPFFVVSGAVTILLFLAALIVLPTLIGIISLFMLYFFRDPERINTAEANAVLAPADGKILGIQYLNDPHNPLNGPGVKISTFMSLFNVHVNRIPMSGKISQITYHPGRFFAANFEKASEQNEHNVVALKTGEGKEIVFVQIAGMIARRIACWVEEQDNVQAGQRFGIIRFGSRVDLYLPKDSRIIAQPGGRVKAGKSVLGYLS
jgi:phosphatidylserine decarboxylase